MPADVDILNRLVSLERKIRNGLTLASLRLTGTLTLSNGAVLSGTYTPTLTNSSNIDASTAADLSYYRVGDKVTVFGSVEIDPTAAASTTLGISLPIASNFGAVGDCAGTIMRGTGGQGHVAADAANDRASAVFVATVTSNATYYLHFSYRII